MRKFLFILFVFSLLTGCSSAGYKNVNVEEAKKLIDDGKVEVIDVRTPEEYQGGHIPDSKLMPLQVLEGMLEELDPEKTYLIVCRSGNRSVEASNILIANDFKNVYNMTGGMNEWTYEVE